MTEHRRWWKNPPFWVALCLGPVLSYFAAQMATNRTIELKQAEYGATSKYLSHQLDLMETAFNGLSARIDAKLGEIGETKAKTDALVAFARDQEAYNTNVVKFMTEITTTMRLKGLPTPKIPEPPRAPELHK